MMKLNDFIAPLSRYTFSTEYITDKITNFISPKLNIKDANLKSFITDTVKELYDNYSLRGYRVIPMMLTENVEDDQDMLALSIAARMLHYGMFLGEIEKDVNEKIKLSALKQGDSSNEEVTRTSDNREDNETTYGKTITKSYTDDTKSMSEISPINADIDTINTPNAKSQTIDGKSGSDVHSGVDSNNLRIINNETDVANKVNISPVSYKMYIDLITEYNIPHFIDDILRFYIWEFNSVR